MSRCNVIVVGASAGGIDALLRLVGGLPADLEAAGAIAVHARGGEALLHRRIYVPAPGRHLLVKRRTVRWVNGPHENGYRPAVDPLFRTAARAHLRRVIGVVLSGALDDGTAGLLAIKGNGGAALVQDPREALFDGMPSSAIANVDVDFVGTIDAIAEELIRRTTALATRGEEETVPDELADELDVVEMDRARSA